MVEERKFSKAPSISTVADITISKEMFIRKKDKITDEYKIGMSNIGTGGYGFVKKAIHKETKQLRAIKSIPRKNIPDMSIFRAEVDILKRLDHPNIVKLYEWYEDSKYCHLVTELCEGGELLDRILDEEHFTEAKAAFYFAEILSALHHCHKKGICHRDLKPENLLFESKEPGSRLKLIDFGLSKIYSMPATKSGLGTQVYKMTSRVGTPFYIAPEVIRGNYDSSCDMWSAGVLLYILLCGCVPFAGDNDFQILEAVKKGEFSFDDEVWDEVSDSVKDLIRKLIAPAEVRLTAENGLLHPWIKSRGTLDKKEISEKHSKTLKSFRCSQKLKQAVLQYIATQLTTKEVETLSQVFNSLDKDGDGKLSFEELKEGMTSCKTDEEIKEIMESVDTDKSGFIDYTEFLAASIEPSIYLQESKLLQAFNLFDKDKSGKISADELKQIIGNQLEDVDDSVWDSMIKEIDINGDGEIDFDEFLKMMYSFKDNISLFA